MHFKKFLLLTNPANNVTTNSVDVKIYPNRHFAVRFVFLTVHTPNFENRTKLLLNKSFRDCDYQCRTSNSAGTCTIIIQGPKSWNKIGVRLFLNKVYKVYKSIILLRK